MPINRNRTLSSFTLNPMHAKPTYDPHAHENLYDTPYNTNEEGNHAHNAQNATNRPAKKKKYIE